MNSTEYFTGKSKIYDAVRPNYAKKLFDFLASKVPTNEKVADIGSGTGIFTKQLLETGYSVYAVEPNRDMRQVAEEKLKGITGFTSIDGDASDTHLKDHSVALVTTAQAFHWFDQQKFKKECQRILQPNGFVAIVYNTRCKSQSTDELIKILKKYCANFHGFSNNLTDQDYKNFFNGDCTIFETDNSQYYDEKQYIGRILSSSYAITPKNKYYQDFVNALRQLCADLSSNGRILMPMKTIVYLGRV